MVKIQNLYSKSNILLICIFTLGTFARAYHLGFKSLWLDEAVLYHIANNPIPTIITENALRNSAPPGFALLLNCIISINDQEVALRFFPFLFGSLSIIAVFHLARKFVDKLYALIPALLVAISPTLVHYSQEVREYSIAFFLACISIHQFLNYLKAPSVRLSIFFVITLMLMLLFQYGLIFLIVTFNLIYIITKRKSKSDLQRWIILQSPLLLMGIFVLNSSLSHQFTSGGFGAYYLSQYYWDGRIIDLPKFIITNTISLLSFATGEKIITGLLFSIGVITSFSQPKHRALFLFILILFSITLLASILRLYPYGGTRQSIYLLPIVYVTISWGIPKITEKTKSHLVSILLIIILLVVGIFQTIKYLNKPSTEETRGLVSELRNIKTQNDRVYVYYGAVPAFNYYNRDFKISNIIIGISRTDNRKEYIDQLESELLKPGPIYLFFSHCFQDECEYILDSITSIRSIDIIAQSQGASLYLAADIKTSSWLETR